MLAILTGKHVQESTWKQAPTREEQQAKSMTVALLAKHPHNSKVLAVFEEIGKDSEFIYQCYNSSQMKTELS